MLPSSCRGGPIIWPLMGKLTQPVFLQQRPKWTGGLRIPELPRLPWEFRQMPLLGGMNGQKYAGTALIQPSIASLTFGFRLSLQQKISNQPNVIFPRTTITPTRFTLAGVSRDSTGAVLANCQVLVFRTYDKVLAAETTSDGSGAWSVIVDRLQQHFMVEYKPGAPDVFGTSLNNRMPS